jgi:phosphatidylinositol alpha-1,6-mannosyltransferase
LLLSGNIPEEKICLVHPGTNPEYFRPMPRDEAFADELGVKGKKVILTVGRLMPRKGQDMVIHALPEVLKSIPDAVCVFCGTGPLESPLRELIRSLQLEPHVVFAGEVPPARLPALYNLADVFLMPNRVSPKTQDTEGFGIVFLEAGACEVPVIGGRSGGVPDAIVEGQTGILVDGQDVHAISDAVVRVLVNPVWAHQLGVNARNRICENLTWDCAANQVRKILQNLRA